MDDLRYRHLTFCQFFFSRDTRKLIAICELMYSSFSDMATCPMATPRHSTFFSWNLMVALMSLICNIPTQSRHPPDYLNDFC